MRIIISILLVGAVIGAVVVGIAGFQGRSSRKPPIELFPDMDRQAKLRPQEPNRFFANHVSSQPAPAGTIGRSEPVQTANGAIYRFEDAPVNSGFINGTTNFIGENPLRVDMALLQRGRVQYDIYCTPCHGKTGDGNGIVKKIGAMPGVANLHDLRIVKMTDGEIFRTVTHGKGLMGAYGPLMPVEDRWASVAYLRVLQLSWLGSTNDLTAGQTAALMKTK